MDVLTRGEDSRPNKSWQEENREGIHCWGTRNSISAVLGRRLEGTYKEAGEHQMPRLSLLREYDLRDHTVLKRKRDVAFPSIQQQVFSKISKQRFQCSSCSVWTNGAINHLTFKGKLKLVLKTVEIVAEMFIILPNLNSSFVFYFVL